MKYQRQEDAIVRVKDGKVVANIEGGEAKPTAPVYYKFMDEFQLLLSQEQGSPMETSNTAQGSDLAEDQPDADEVAEMIEKENDPDAEPVKSRRFGDKTYGYPTWLHKTDPEEAAKRYKGRDIPEYEAAKLGFPKTTKGIAGVVYGLKPMPRGEDGQYEYLSIEDSSLLDKVAASNDPKDKEIATLLMDKRNSCAKSHKDDIH